MPTLILYPMISQSRYFPTYLFIFICAFLSTQSYAQPGSTQQPQELSSFHAMRFRMPGPYRGGRVTAVAGYPGHKPTLYMGATGGGVWKSTNNGLSYTNISDGYFSVGSIGSLAVAAGDSNVVYAGTGSAGIRSNVSTVPYHFVFIKSQCSSRDIILFHSRLI